MAKGGSGKLSKLKCMIRRWHSSSRLTRTAPSASSRLLDEEDGAWHSTSFHGDEVPPGHHPVYVGESRRRYLVSEELVSHPLFRVLVERSDGAALGGGGTAVGCEVVLFEHLLWMLENTEPPPESLDELVEFYACRRVRHLGGPDSAAPNRTRS